MQLQGIESLASGNGDLCGTEAVLAERGVLHVARGVALLEGAEQGVAQHTVAFAVDEDDARAAGLEVGTHGVVEHLELVVQNVARLQAYQGVEQRVGVQVHLYHTGLALLAGSGCGLRGRGGEGGGMGGRVRVQGLVQGLGIDVRLVHRSVVAQHGA